MSESRDPLWRGPGPMFGTIKAAVDLLDRTKGRRLNRDEVRLLGRYADRFADQILREAGEASIDDRDHKDPA